MRGKDVFQQVYVGLFHADTHASSEGFSHTAKGVIGVLCRYQLIYIECRQRIQTGLDLDAMLTCRRDKAGLTLSAKHGVSRS